uniref:PH domain-containing protein n=1 Tax=Panagrellus redivivus TaxID=6233 RepID=A0A7E4UTA6_PANRE
MSATTVSSSTAGSIRSHQSNGGFEEVCHSRLHSLSSMADELDVVAVPRRGDLSHAASVDDSDVPAPSPTLSARHNNAVDSASFKGEMNASMYEDDPHVYVNFSPADAARRKFEDIDRRSRPPTPGEDDVPIRVLANGWKEYKTPGGRSFYFNDCIDLGQWKPPRSNQLTASMARRSKAPSAPPCSWIETKEASVPKDSPMVISKPVVVQHTTFPVDGSSQVVSSHSPVLEMSSSDELDPRLVSVMSKSMISPVTKQNIATMTNSVDSGLGRSSISYKNQAFGIAKPIHDVMSESLTEISEAKPSSSGRDALENYIFAQGNFATTAVRQGYLEKMKLSDCGMKNKKKEWVHAYAYLAGGHLLFYKDQKRAAKTGKHYPPPTDVCDLRGAQIGFVPQAKLKDKRRKRVLELVMPNLTEYWFCSSVDAEIDSWHHILRQTINSLPIAKAYPLPENGSLSRRPSDSSQSGKGVVTAPIKAGSIRQSQKFKVKKTPSKEIVDVNEVTPTRDSIIERLLRFFRSRPSVEQLRERGIYRPEPIFGSTLTAICVHDHSHVPRFLTEIINVIEKKGLELDGIYRVSGNLSAIQKIRCQVDHDHYEVLWKEDDIHVLTGAVKLFFRELSEPIFPVAFNKEFMAAIRQTNLKTKTKTIDELLCKLPIIHKETLRLLLLHLLKVSSYSSTNRMTNHSLAIMFGPALFSTDDKPPVRAAAGTPDKKTKLKVQKSNGIDRNTSGESSSNEPNQILAYKMIVFGQIVEFILKEFNKFTAFIPPNGFS